MSVIMVRKLTAKSFTKDMATLGIEQVFTSYGNPKGNADTERMMQTIEEEVIWLNEFETFEKAIWILSDWIEVDYNRLYVYSELDYRVSKNLRLYTISSKS